VADTAAQDHPDEPHGMARQPCSEPLRHLYHSEPIQKGTTTMHDYNLAGLATIAALALFFPGCGLFGLRRQRIEARKAHRNEQLKQLMIEEEKRMERVSDHACRLDLNTCQTSVTDQGHVYGSCEICGQPIYIGLASLYEWEKGSPR
jgi:hypothetical protein